MYIAPRQVGIQPPGDKVSMSTGTSFHFSHLLLISNHRQQLFLKNQLLYCLPYTGSVLFRTSAYTDAKQASRVTFSFRDLSRQNHLVPGHLIPVFRQGHLVPTIIMGFNSLMLFFYVLKFTF